MRRGKQRPETGGDEPVKCDKGKEENGKKNETRDKPMRKCDILGVPKKSLGLVSECRFGYRERTG